MGNSHLGLLCDVGELSALLSGSVDIETFFRRLVVLVAQHLKADVCSIYLHEEDHARLRLVATEGLNQEAVGVATLKFGEGLVGLSLKELRPICVEQASRNPDFKYVPNTGEDRFESFLAVPVQKAVAKIGVLVVQRERNKPFTENDILALRASAAQLAGAIENARILMSLRPEKTPAAALVSNRGQELIKGESAAPGIALATTITLDWVRFQQQLIQQKSAKHYTIDDFNRALLRTQKQLTHLQTRLDDRLPEVASLIFTAHQMMLKDSNFMGAMRQRIDLGENPPSAVFTVAQHYVNLFNASPHAYVREKAQDVEDVAKRLAMNILTNASDTRMEYEGCIVIARGLFPSEMLKLASENVAGIILVSGGITSHVSILARSLEIPTVIANQPSLLELPDHTPLLLDAGVGNIFIRPSDGVKNRYAERERVHAETVITPRTVSAQTHTQDGTRVHLFANVNLLSELTLANNLGAEGVGLYRSEFPFLIRPTFPTEAEELVVYGHLVEKMAGKPVTIRTLDVGGDKALAYYDHISEENPALGLRSIRFSLLHRDILTQQVRAILQAGADHQELRILFPMISSLSEFTAAEAIVATARVELTRAGIAHHPHPALGIMIETPAAAEIADTLAAAADFLCIGANDFVQYMLAVDRANAQVADYYQPYHPAVLRGLKRILTAALAQDTEISVCGEMAHESMYVPFFLGIGLRRFSVDPRYIQDVAETVTQCSIAKAEALATAVLAEANPDRIAEMLSAASEPKP